MSLQAVHREPRAPVATTRKRIRGTLQAALDNMALKGLRWQDAAKAANYRTDSMWRQLQLGHVQAYLRSQRQVFRESLTDRATFRMIELSEQDDNMAAAVTATRALMNEHDQSVAGGAAIKAPGLQIVIMQAPAPSHGLPNPITIDGAVNDINDFDGKTSS